MKNIAKRRRYIIESGSSGSFVLDWKPVLGHFVNMNRLHYKVISCISIIAKMASRFKMVTLIEVTELEEAAEKLHAQKNTFNWVRVFYRWCDENSLENGDDSY